MKQIAVIAFGAALSGLVSGAAFTQQLPPVKQPPPATGQQPPVVGKPNPATPGQMGFNQGNVPSVPWFSDPGVRQHLNFTDLQTLKLNQSYDEIWNRYNAAVTGIRTSNNKERADRMQALWLDFNKQSFQSAQKILNDQQFQRYRQLYWQNHGIGVINDPLLQQQMNLTPDQLGLLQNYAAKQDSNMNELSILYSTDPQAAMLQYNNLRRQNAEYFNSILTEQQRQAWREAIGEPYNFAPPWHLKK